MLSGQEYKEKDEGTKKLEELLADLPKSIQESVAAGMATAMKGLQQQQAPAQTPAIEVKPAPELIPDEEALNQLDNAGMVGLIAQLIDQKLGKGADKINTQITDISNRLTTTDLKSQVKEVAASHTDFWEYRDTMGGLAKQYPDLTPADLYNLAKSHAPEIGEKLATAAAEKKAEEDKDNVVVFGGLLPTSGRGSEDTEGMDFKKASEKSWEEVMSELPAEIIGGNNN